jgi:23S rRNA (uridine2552-2'-O)-methyltransferase
MASRKTSKIWMHQHVNDHFVHKAKAEGWRSRAVFKLQEIDQCDKLLKPGSIVVDLGSTPGGWSQVAIAKVGEKGRVIATDLLEMEPIPGVTFLQGDFTSDEMLTRLEAELGALGKVDLVLSDMAPNLTGVAATDQARGIALVELALDFSLDWLKPRGALLVKVFHGSGFEAFLKLMRESFQEVAVRKPDASRDKSSEVYLLGRQLRRPAQAANP